MCDTSIKIVQATNEWCTLLLKTSNFKRIIAVGVLDSEGSIVISILNMEAKRNLLLCTCMAYEKTDKKDQQRRIDGYEIVY